jgi:TFIIF-interacting CTD phosphatase-like protein
VLDLDETLVHYYEIGSQGTFNVRPGVDIFLKEMAELYEVVIFTAAMQDVSFFFFIFNTLTLYIIVC